MTLLEIIEIIDAIWFNSESPMGLFLETKRNRTRAKPTKPLAIAHLASTPEQTSHTLV
jgi:hypothetical protein